MEVKLNKDNIENKQIELNNIAKLLTKPDTGYKTSLENIYKEIGQTSSNGLPVLNIKISEPYNIVIGIGMWSKKYGISRGLPIDVLNMLLAAIAIQKECNKIGIVSKIYILLADSLLLDAVKKDLRYSEEKALQTVQYYEQTFCNLFRMLSIENVILIQSSKLEKEQNYNAIITDLEKNEKFVDISKNDPDHYKYFVAQTAIIKYFEGICGVKIKISWHCFGNEYTELAFDKLYKSVLPEFDISFIYTLSGLAKEQGCTQGKSPYADYQGNEVVLLDNTKKKVENGSVCFGDALLIEQSGKNKMPVNANYALMLKNILIVLNKLGYQVDVDDQTHYNKYYSAVNKIIKCEKIPLKQGPSSEMLVVQYKNAESVEVCK